MSWPELNFRLKAVSFRRQKLRLLPLLLCSALSFPVAAQDATFNADFRDTELTTFIDTVARNLHKTIILGPGVQGKVSIRSVDALNESQYYQLFLNVLEAQGYAVIPMDNGVLKVVKSSSAKMEPLPVTDAESERYAGDEMITRIVSVKNISVRELAPLLRQLIDNAGSGNVVNYDPSNVIMLTGRTSVVNRLAKIVERVDQTGTKSNEVVTLHNASAAEVVRVIDSLNKNADQNQPASLKHSVVADERTNSVVINGDPGVREKLKRLIRQLDAETQTSGNSQVFFLKYSKAEELLDVLNQVSGTLKEAKKEQGGGMDNDTSVSIAASKNSNAIVVTAATSEPVTITVALADDLTEREQHEMALKRPPRVTKRFALTGGRVEFTAPYGGLIYVQGNSKDKNPVSFTFTGVVKAPYFKDGAWVNDLNSPAPLGEIESESFVYTGPKKNLTAANLQTEDGRSAQQEFSWRLDQFAAAMHDFYGRDVAEAGVDMSKINVFPKWPQVDWAGNPSHANQGDRLVYNDAVYQANWWSNSTPGSDGSWSLVCKK